MDLDKDLSLAGLGDLQIADVKVEQLLGKNCFHVGAPFPEDHREGARQ
jgi:hypothetical protein